MNTPPDVHPRLYINTFSQLQRPLYFATPYNNEHLTIESWIADAAEDALEGEEEGVIEDAEAIEDEVTEDADEVNLEEEVHRLACKVLDVEVRHLVCKARVEEAAEEEEAAGSIAEEVEEAAASTVDEGEEDLQEEAEEVQLGLCLQANRSGQTTASRPPGFGPTFKLSVST